jgi:hypothetical protein
MATPRKPNAKRGRPSKDFWIDPHRYAIAIAFALRQLNISEQQSCVLVATFLLGKKVDERLGPPRRKPGVGMIPVGRSATYERVQHLATTSASILNFASTLKKKARRAKGDPGARLWLAANATGIATFLHTGFVLDYDLEQLVEYVVACADRAVAGTLQAHFLNALVFDLPELFPRVIASG